MALTIGDNFSYQGAKPLDTRLQYATIAEMASKADSTLYDGIIAYCKADGKNYQWKSTNTVDPTLGKWREFQSGGGGASELANLDDVDLDDPADGEVLKYNATEEKWVNGEVAGRAKSTAIAPVFDETVTYAAGDRVTYEDELYVFNTAHTGAWDAADADKSDVDSEMPEKLTAAQMAAIKAAFVIDAPRNGYPVLFDETGAEHFVGWYKLANGTKKPVYEKCLFGTVDAYNSIQYISLGFSLDKLLAKQGIFTNRLDMNDTNDAMNSGVATPVYDAYDSDYENKYAVYNIPSSKSNWVGKSYILKITYTKTTDTPQ